MAFIFQQMACSVTNNYQDILLLALCNGNFKNERCYDENFCISGGAMKSKMFHQ